MTCPSGSNWQSRRNRQTCITELRHENPVTIRNKRGIQYYKKMMMKYKQKKIVRIRKRKCKENKIAKDEKRECDTVTHSSNPSLNDSIKQHLQSINLQSTNHSVSYSRIKSITYVLGHPSGKQVLESCHLLVVSDKYRPFNETIILFHCEPAIANEEPFLI